MIAGEVIEHLDAPGPFLHAMRALTRPDGRLVITTPNAFRALFFLAPAAGVELVHPDHTCYYSHYTLRNLLRRNGWAVARALYYQDPLEPVRADRGVARWLAGHAVNSVQRIVGLVSRRTGYWSDGLIVCATPAPEDERR